VLDRDAGGLRHFVDGQPVHCGYLLELQSVERIYDDEGDWTLRYLDEWTPVRYEASLWRREECVVTLYADVGGHTATLRHWEGMRFRWPKEERQ